MDAIKKQRKTLRAAFTRAQNAFTTEMENDSSWERKLVAFQLLESKMAELDVVHAKYGEKLCESTLDEDAVSKEMESDDDYKTAYLEAKLRVSHILGINNEPQTRAVENVSSSTQRRTLKLPTIELPKFNGHVKEWLPFWSVFKKIHEDPLIRKEDKFQYLVQATVTNSRAYDLVSSFPPIADNYDKVVKSLKNRFGRDDVVVEFYVRELLGLVLQNAVKSQTKAPLANIYDKLESYIRALDTLGITTDKCAAMLYPLVESSLPEDVLRAWQRSTSRDTNDGNGRNDTKDRLDRLLEFLQAEVENQERIDMALQGFTFSTEAEKQKKQRHRTETTKEPASASALLTSKEERQVECIFCKNKHESQHCEIAKGMSWSERKECVKKANACFVCIKRGHISKNCRVKVRCAWCGKRHLLLFCSNFKTKNETSTNVNGSNDDNKNNWTENSLAATCESPRVCLQTLRIKLYSDSREKIVRAVIDTASQRSYIRADLAGEVGYVPRKDIEIVHSLFGGVKSKARKHDEFLARMRSLDGSYACNFSVLSQDTICDTIPCVRSDSWVEELRERKIVLTDVGGKNSSIDVLIGADVAGKLLTGKRYDVSNGLVAFETLLGWTVMGKLPKTRDDERDDHVMLNTMFVQEADLSSLWRLDLLGITDPIEKINKATRNEITREYVRSTSEIDEGNRYVVRLPWKELHAPLTENFDIAERRLKTTVERLNKQSLFSAYDNVFKEWLTDNIIEIVPDNEIQRTCHYLPHRPVFKWSGTTKIRPVFDASASKKGHPSLNQCLERGPNLLELVPSSLNRFRERNIGVISDIKAAFLQIIVNKTDRDSLRFLWIVNGKVTIFRHCRVVFGLSPSPFLLSEVIILLLERALEDARKGKNCQWSEQSVLKLRNSFYVDNCVTSVDTKDELQTFIYDAQRIMRMGSFDLRGWESSGDVTESDFTRVLGIFWNKQNDVLTINPTVVNTETPKIITKRTILATANRVFDPIGFTAPVSLQPKVLLTQLWTEKIDWDTRIDDKRSKEFVDWLENLPLLKEIELPRALGDGRLSIHTFGDASGLAYAAAVFARIESENFVNVVLLSARTRIAPKGATIPRLELMAATIAVRLTNLVTESLTRRVESVTYWTDSTTVLAWLNRDLQWGTFVHNRVKEIRSLSDVSRWRHVPGEVNPADLPSRGCNASQLVNSRWWLGPSWLQEPECFWPCTQPNADEREVKTEIKRSALTNMLDSSDSHFKPSNLFSTYTKLIRFVAWVRRFLKNKRSLLERRKQGSADKEKDFECTYLSRGNRKLLYLSFSEVREAEISLLKHLQKVMFENSDKNKLSSFKVSRDENGLCVLKTKILNRNDNNTFLRPILLDKHDVVDLLVRETHERCGHTGTQIVMNALRERFWIISIRRTVKSIIAKCVNCKRYKAKHMTCEPPPLPIERVRDSKVFEVTGIDFAGPIFIKGGGKGWICVFTCAVYRAVHFELASSLSVPEFVECLRRFIARRGRPRYVFTDNGTNFCGTSRALGSLDWEKIMKQTSILQIDWRFNPPSAPWWGGWWERIIGVLKTVLRKILGKASLSYESLTTSLCDVEAILNSRPLTYVSDDPDDLKPLTPAMFLHEIEEIGVPDLDMLSNKKLNKKYQYRQKILNDLRARFRIEYLSQLLLKGSKEEERKINVGDIVLIGDDIRKRIDWPLARVVKTISGRDGNARVYILKTKNGLLKRPIQRVYPLEIEQDNSDLTKQLNEIPNKEANCDNSNLNFKQIDSFKDCNSIKETVRTRVGRVSKKPDRFMY